MAGNLILIIFRVITIARAKAIPDLALAILNCLIFILFHSSSSASLNQISYYYKSTEIKG